MVIRKVPRPTLRCFSSYKNKGALYNRYILSTYSGRYGIYQALSALGLTSEDEVLLPAYHCLAMVQPIIAYGCRPIFYRIDSTMQVTVDQVMKYVSERTRIVFLVHYFGIYQRETEKIARELGRMGIVLLEDCAHVIPFSKHKGGTLGDVAIFSPWKFLPLLDGAILRFNNRNLCREMGLRNPPLCLAFKNAKNILERELALSEDGVFGKWYLYLDSKLRRGRNLLQGMAEDRAISTEILFYDEYVDFKATSLSRWSMRAVDFEAIYRRRSEISCALFKKVYEAELFDPPLFLPGNISDCVFGFPIMVGDRNKAVSFLKSKRIAHFTFGDRLHDEEYLKPDSPELRFSRNLLFVPLLQDFGCREVDYLAASVKELLSRGL